nr:hypothetical protein B0A51_10250 [Rachicladosporium sp. CCFEE 5018]
MTKGKRSSGSKAKHDLKTGKVVKEAARQAALAETAAPLALPIDPVELSPSPPAKRQRVDESLQRLLHSLPGTATLSTRKVRLSDSADELLVRRGYKVASAMTNAFVIEKFGPCSTVAHLLHAWEEARKDPAKIGMAKLVTGDSCRNAAGLAAMTQRLRYSCTLCGIEYESNTSPHRTIAVLKLRPTQLWKAVIPYNPVLIPGKAALPLYECSATCNELNSIDKNHCINEKHLFLETSAHNTERKSHHTGAEPCWCPEPCLRGPKARFVHYEDDANVGAGGSALLT